MNNYCIILVTASSEPEAQLLAQGLLDAQLAACISITPVKSYYLWQGKVNQDNEWQLIIKTKVNSFNDVAKKIKELHSYEVPEIIALPIIQGEQSYLNWIGANVLD